MARESASRFGATILLGIGCLPTLCLAEAAPLTHAELTQCASQIQALRQDSARLTQETYRADARKSALEAKAAALRAEGESISPDNTAAAIDLSQRRVEHNRETEAFNTQIGQLRSEIVAINAVKQQYHENCSNRPYRRSDFNGLSNEAQQAMRSGLADVTVPYLGN